MKKSQFRVLFSFLIMTLIMLSCENNLEMILPQGPQGEQGDKGDKGDPGKSAFELWIEYFGKDPNTSIEDFFNSLKGKDGKDGDVPIIGENGNWIIGGTDTGIPARGKDGTNGTNGKDGVTPVIGENGNWIIDGVDTGIPARGKDGFTPVIGDNGNWFINGEDTGKPSRGANGQDGKTPTVAIGPGPDYYWIIDGVVTNITAKGENGRDGNDGKDGKDGFTPVIGDNGNWFIDGQDTGKPSVIIPVIGPGPNYNWFINGQDTGMPSRGKDGEDGKDGLTPEIGDNGNWWIDGKDTGKPSVIIPVIGDGPNYHWFIDGVDTGKPSRGIDGVNGTPGVDGKSAYDLWKEAVDLCDGSITDKAGNDWPCAKNSWEDFLEWLQGGDVSVLHEYWKTLPGNEGKTISEFIEELFDCHCDGVTVGVSYEDTCVELNPDGTLKGTYEAKLTIGGKAGTSVVVTGPGVSRSGNITNDQEPITFTIPRGAESIPLTIVCTESGNAVTKNAIIPALKYIQLESVTTVTPVEGEEKDNVVLHFATSPKELSVEGVVIYQNGAITEAGTAQGWASVDGKTFTKTYDRKATVQKPVVQAKGDGDVCSRIVDAFTIPQLTPVEVTPEDLALEINGECDLLLTLTAPTGLEVKASYGADPRTTIDFVYSDEKYTVTVPRLRTVAAYNTLTVTVADPSGNAGTVELKPTVTTAQLLATPFKVTWTELKTVDPRTTGGGTSYPYVEGKYENLLDKEITITVSRPAGGMTNERFPWMEGNATAGIASQDIVIPAKGTKTIIFHRDVTPTFAAGNYVITSTTDSQCEPFSVANKQINNQRDFSYAFRKITETPGGYPGGPGGGTGGSLPYDPDYEVPTPEEGYTIFELIITDAIPNTYVQFLLNTSEGVKSVIGGSKLVDENGTLTILVKMKDSDLAIADGGLGEIKFFDTKTSSTSTHAKSFTFNAPK